MSVLLPAFPAFIMISGAYLDLFEYAPPTPDVKQATDFSLLLANNVPCLAALTKAPRTAGDDICYCTHRVCCLFFLEPVMTETPTRRHALVQVKQCWNSFVVFLFRPFCLQAKSTSSNRYGRLLKSSIHVVVLHGFVVY